MNLIPFKLSPHIIHYFFQEFEGSTKRYAGREVKTIPLDPNSFIGKFIISNLRKLDYPVKDISHFSLFIEMAHISRKTYCVKQRLFKRENLTNSFVELPEEYMKDVDDMLDDLFRHNFFYFVEGYSKDASDGKVRRAIRLFMDRYQLWEFDQFNMDQLSRLYYRMRNDKPGTRLQRKKML